MVAVVASVNVAHEYAGLHRRAVISRVLRRLAQTGNLDPKPPSDGQPGDLGFPWLAEYWDELASRQATSTTMESAPQWWDAQLDEFEPTTPEKLPLQLLDRSAARILVAAGLIEDDVRFGSLFARLQDPIPSRRPCVGMLAWLLTGPAESAGEIQARCHQLVNRGLVSVDNPTDPRAEWVLRLPVALWDLLHLGSIMPASLPATLRHRPADSFPPLSGVVVPRELKQTIGRLPEILGSQEISALVVRGMEGSGRHTLVGALGRALGQDVLVHDGQVGDDGWRLLGPLATLGKSLPVIMVRPAPGETIQLPSPPDLHQPVAVIIGRAGGVAGVAVERSLGINLGQPGPGDRRALWRAAGVAAGSVDLDEIVSRFLLTPGNIHRAAPIAAAAAKAAGRDLVTAADVQTASRTLNRQVLETLATSLEPLHRAAAPVLTPAGTAELETLLARCRQREALLGAVGVAFQGNLNRGVRALFSGPSGTGKTLAARYLAACLKLDLYRLDLAAVVNKYIGETERNLDQVLSRAEELDVVLLLDEGDALMARRTDVSNSNDRYANLETNFLLQRLETFEGIVIVTTNTSNNIDTAFLRRLDATIEFVPPDPSQRWQIWLAHLPANHEVSPSLLEETARRCALTGGHIRNATMHAALRALERGTPINDADLSHGVALEYKRIGASSPI